MTTSETIAEIVECMRGRGEDTRMDAALWRRYADRIEAAWKREKAEIEAGATSKMLDGATIIDNRSCGNAAAMREALTEIRDCIKEHPCQLDEDSVFEIVTTALSAPPRNCDRFEDELDAQLAFLNEVWLISVDRDTRLERDRFENWTDEMKSSYAKWLFAPAAERKGDGK